MKAVNNNKSKFVSFIKEKLGPNKSIFLMEYRGSTSNSMVNLYKEARERGVYLIVAKNTLIKKAIECSEYAGLADHMKGPLIYAISDNPVEAAKLCKQMSSENNNLLVKSAYTSGVVITKENVLLLADIPSREVLIARLMGSCNSPVTSFVRTLNEIPTKMVRALVALRDQKLANSN